MMTFSSISSLGLWYFSPSLKKKAYRMVLKIQLSISGLHTWCISGPRSLIRSTWALLIMKVTHISFLYA